MTIHQTMWIASAENLGTRYTLRENPAGGCTSYDVIAPWPDMTRSKFFYQKLRKGCPISCAKFQHDPPHRSGCIAEKPQGGSHRPPPPARARVNPWMFQGDRPVVVAMTSIQTFLRWGHMMSPGDLTLIDLFFLFTTCVEKIRVRAGVKKTRRGAPPFLGYLRKGTGGVQTTRSMAWVETIKKLIPPHSPTSPFLVRHSN